MELAWSAYVEGFSSDRDTADPLGFRAVATRFARELVPGLTQVTSLTRGFSLIALGIDLLSKVHERDRDELFLHFERLWVAAQVKHHGAVPEVPFAGKIAAQAYLGLGKPYPLAKPILAHQLSAGLWGQYRKASVHFGLLNPMRVRSARPRFAKLTPDGNKIAKAARDHAFEPDFQLARYIKKGTITQDVLDHVLPNGDRPDKEEVAILSQAMGKADKGCGGALGNLRKVYDGQNGDTLKLELETFKDKKYLKLLSKRQQEALKAAGAVDELMKKVEEPYRRWVTGEKPDTPAPSLWQHESWQILQAEGCPEIDSLHKTARTAAEKGKDVFVALHEHHTWLARRRGSEPWEPGVPHPAHKRFEPYDFCLNAATWLFGEGVKP